jgi:hypothetical protein
MSKLSCLQVKGVLLNSSGSKPIQFDGYVHLDGNRYSLDIVRMSRPYGERTIVLEMCDHEDGDRLHVLVDEKEVDLSDMMEADDRFYEGLIPYPECLNTAWWEQFIK